MFFWSKKWLFGTIGHTFVQNFTKFGTNMQLPTPNWVKKFFFKKKFFRGKNVAFLPKKVFSWPWRADFFLKLHQIWHKYAAIKSKFSKKKFSKKFFWGAKFGFFTPKKGFIWPWRADFCLKLHKIWHKYATTTSKFSKKKFGGGGAKFGFFTPKNDLFGPGGETFG